MNDIDRILQKFRALPPEQKKRVEAFAAEAQGDRKWLPNPGPQASAYFSKADELLFGGEPGGGKSQLCLGLAFNEHKRAHIVRRKYPDLAYLTECAIKIHGSRDGYNGSPPPRLRIDDEHLIEFGAYEQVGSEQGRQGHPYDLLAFDEPTQMAERQIRFLMGWNRTDDPKQRVRTVFATNPPLTAEGLWIVRMFAPWLDPRFPRPAKPGELRWYVAGELEGDEDRWVDGPDPVDRGGKLVFPKSRTFIPSSHKDNPAYAATDYQRTLDAMLPEDREVLMGGFRTSFRDQPQQIIPTAWVQRAMERWTPTIPGDVPMCAQGVDATGGGIDPMIVASRYDGWYAPMGELPAKKIPAESAGATAAGYVLSLRRDACLVVVDMGGGYGGPLYERLIDNEVDARVFRGAESSLRRTTDGKMRFTNKRTAALWLFREALDPGQPGGSPIALPRDPEIIADLTAPTYKVTPNGYAAEPKEAVCKRLGRSTNKGDAIVMAWFEGPRQATDAMEWMDREHGRRVSMPKVIGGARQPLSAQRSVRR